MIALRDRQRQRLLRERLQLAAADHEHLLRPQV
jgi:hypothetical protein